MHAVIKSVAGLALVAGLAWAGSIWLKPLGDLLPMTRSMVTTTRAILDETRGLQAGVTEVRASLKDVQRQESLLAEQEALTRQMLASLGQQERLATEARGLLVAILQAEQTTAKLTLQADQAGQTTLQTVQANSAELNQLVVAASQVGKGSAAMDKQVDDLLVAMEGSAENFAVIGKLKTAASNATARTSDWFSRFWEWISW